MFTLPIFLLLLLSPAIHAQDDATPAPQDTVPEESAPVEPDPIPDPPAEEPAPPFERPVPEVVPDPITEVQPDTEPQLESDLLSPESSATTPVIESSPIAGSSPVTTVLASPFEQVSNSPFLSTRPGGNAGPDNDHSHASLQGGDSHKENAHENSNHHAAEEHNHGNAPEHHQSSEEHGDFVWGGWGGPSRGHHHHHHHSSEEHGHGHGWGGWEDHHDHHHHSSEEHGNGGWGRGRGGSWHRYLQGDRDRNGGGSDWMRYMNRNDQRGGCGLVMALLGVCGNRGRTSDIVNNNIAQPPPNWDNSVANSGSNSPWWQQRLGDAGSQKIPNPLPADTLGSSGSGSFSTGSSGNIWNPSVSLPTVNVPKGMGSFDEPTSIFGTGGEMNKPKGTGSFDLPGARSSIGSGSGSGAGNSGSSGGSFDWIKQPSFGTGTGGLKDTSSFGSGTGGLKGTDSFGSVFGTGTGGMKDTSSTISGSGGLKDTSSFGSGGFDQPSSFGDWSKPSPSLPSIPSQAIAEKSVPCKSSEFVGFSNGRMRFKCDCGLGGISYQEDQCTARAPALRAPVIHNDRRPDATFDWIGR